MSTKGNGHRTETPDVSHIRNVEVTHETSDINVRGVLTFVVVLTVLTAAVSCGLWYLFKFLNTEKAKERPPGPLASRRLPEDQRLPPEPRLQAAPGFAVTLENGQRVSLEKDAPQAEYRALRRQWESELRGELKDQMGNSISIPIDHAIQQVVSGEGLPTRAKTAPGKLQDYAISLPTAASSGRETEKRLQ